MALLGGNRLAWLYTDNEGNVWRVAAQKAMTDQAKLGGSASDGTEPEKPSAIKMRRCTVSNGTYSRVVPVYTTNAPITVAGETVNVNRAGDSRTLVSAGGYIPEGGPRRNVTRQTA